MEVAAVVAGVAVRTESAPAANAVLDATARTKEAGMMLYMNADVLSSLAGRP